MHAQTCAHVIIYSKIMKVWYVWSFLFQKCLLYSLCSDLFTNWNWSYIPIILLDCNRRHKMKVASDPSKMRIVRFVLCATGIIRFYVHFDFNIMNSSIYWINIYGRENFGLRIRWIKPVNNATCHFIFYGELHRRKHCFTTSKILTQLSL